MFCRKTLGRDDQLDCAPTVRGRLSRHFLNFRREHRPPFETNWCIQIVNQCTWMSCVLPQDDYQSNSSRHVTDHSAARGGPSEFGFLNSGANPARISNLIAAFESWQDGLGCHAFCRKTLIGDDQLECTPKVTGRQRRRFSNFWREYPSPFETDWCV